jgi:hypothetical protein
VFFAAFLAPSSHHSGPALSTTGFSAFRLRQTVTPPAPANCDAFAPDIAPTRRKGGKHLGQQSIAKKVFHAIPKVHTCFAISFCMFFQSTTSRVTPGKSAADYLCNDVSQYSASREPMDRRRFYPHGANGIAWEKSHG